MSVSQACNKLYNDLNSLNSKLEKKTQNISGTINAGSTLVLSFTEITNKYPFYSINIDSCSNFSVLNMMCSTMKDGYLKVVLGNISNNFIDVSVTSTGIKL